MVYVPSNPLAVQKKKRSKYGNTKVYAAGRKFDSIIERDRFHFLTQEKQRGKIRNLRCQVDFLIEVNGEKICKYIADFAYEKNVDGCWLPVVEDVKGGYKLPADFVLKRKLMLAVHGVEVQIVKQPALPN